MCVLCVCVCCVVFVFQAEDGIRDLVRSRGLGDVYKRQRQVSREFARMMPADAVLFRMGGDEFAILLEGPSAIADAAGVASTVSYTHLTLPTSDLV